MQLTPFKDLKAELRQWDLDSVAEAAGVNPRTIQYWMSGRTKSPHLRTTMRVAKVVGYRVELVRKSQRLKAVA